MFRAPAVHHALKHGVPMAQNLRVFDQYVSSFDSRYES